jgi:hypothetical protein
MNRTRVLACVLFLADAALRGAETPPDPARALNEAVRALSPGEEGEYRLLFEKLAAPNFDERENAHQRLLLRGPALFRLAEEYAKHKDPEIAGAAARLGQQIYTEFDGHWPVDEALRGKLEGAVERLEMEAMPATMKELLQLFAGKHGVPLLFDPRFPPSAEAQPAQPFQEKTVGEALGFLARSQGLTAVPRGGLLLLTSAETAERLRATRHVFDWKDLKLDRDEARRVAEGLRRFFPEVTTELHASSEALSVRGPPGCVERAARLAALLRPGAPEALWPAPAKPPDLPAVLAMLTQPAVVYLDDDDPLVALAQWRKSGQAVRVWCEGKTYDGPPYPVQVRALNNLSLKLKDVPFGLAVRWLAARASFAPAELKPWMLSAGVDADGRVQLRVGTRRRDVLALAVGGCDVNGLSWGEQPGEKADTALTQRLREKLARHLEVFPEFSPDEDLRVLHGRLLVQGSPAAVAYALELARKWKADGRAPPCEWYEKLDKRLDAELEWDGQGLTAGTLLKRLRNTGGVPILLIESEDGDPAYFRLNREQAELLPPGKQTLRALIEDLAAKAHAKWEVRWGAVVMSPAAPAPPPKEKQAEKKPDATKPGEKQEAPKEPIAPESSKPAVDGKDKGAKANPKEPRRMPSCA